MKNKAFLVQNELESKECQEWLFKQDYRWFSGIDFVKFEKFPQIIFLNVPKYMGHGDMEFYEKECKIDFQLIEFKLYMRKVKLERILND
jgi:hypothetical protein